MAENLVSNTRKRQRKNNNLFQMNQDIIMDDDSIINQMLSKQTAYLNNNLNFNSSAIQESDDDIQQDINNNNNNFDNDDDLVFIKEQPIVKHNEDQYSSSFNYTASTGTGNYYKKQRTISLPQLPLSKLIYESGIPTHFHDSNFLLIPKTQTDDELLNLTGSSAKTLNANKLIQLKLLNPIDNTSTEQQDSSIFSRKLKTLNNKFKTDKDGHYIYQNNDTFGENNRFIANDLLGQGTFGKVLKCYDNESKQFVAVKIIRAVDRYREAAKTELRVLNTIARNDRAGSFQCLLLLDCFDYKNHICLITNLHGKSIYDFMCANGVARFPGSHIQAIARQLIRSICFLHDLNIIHTDIKPENILLCDDSNYFEYQLPNNTVSSLSKRRKLASNNGIRKILKTPEIKIIDFGSAVYHDEYHPPIISTRHYRAPEIVFGLSWSFPCDIWSIACVLVELTTGESLYPIHNNYEHMAMMQRINGEQFPTKLIDNMLYKYENNIGNLPPDLNNTVIKHFNKSTKSLMWPEIDPYTEKIVTEQKVIKRIDENCHRLDILIAKFLKIDLHDPTFTIDWNLSPGHNWKLIRNITTVGKETFLFWFYFLDLLKKLFEFDPTKRITAREALDHEWFNHGILDEGITSFY